MAPPPHHRIQQDLEIDLPQVTLAGVLDVPADSPGVVVFAHGSGSSRHSTRNRYVARVLQEAGFATLLMDLLTPDEERVDDATRELRFDIDLLAERLVGAKAWLARQDATRGLPIGYFGASTGGGAALVAAARDRSTSTPSSLVAAGPI